MSLGSAAASSKPRQDRSIDVIPAIVSTGIHIVVLGLIYLVSAIATQNEQEPMEIQVVLNPPPPLVPVERSLADQSAESELSRSNASPAAPEAPNLTQAAAQARPSASQNTPTNQQHSTQAAAPQRSAAPSQNQPSQSADSGQVGASSGQSSESQSAAPTQSRNPTSLNNFLGSDEQSNNAELPSWFNETAAQSAESQASTSNPGNQNNQASDQSGRTSSQENSQADDSVSDALNAINSNANQVSSSSDRAAQSPTSSQSDSSSNSTSQSSSSLPQTLGGNIADSGREPVSSQRLDLSRYLGTTIRQANWPPTLTVRFRVDDDGMATVLNLEEFSAYNQIYQAVQQMFLDGQVFDADPGADDITGVIEYRFR